jgi:hypothetical protein
MNKDDFRPDTRCTISWRNPQGRVQAANVYVFKVCERFLIGRLTGDDALLRKIDYQDVLKVVSTTDVAPVDRYALPAAVTDENTWRDRVVMQHYATSPRRGK